MVNTGMEKLVICYWEGDEFEGGNVDVPILYESAEAFMCDLEACIETAIRARLTGIDIFRVGRHEFRVGDFMDIRYNMNSGYTLPDILTLDEWFEQYHNKL